jgi:ABC-type histidine transport system ATPase subunit
VIWAADAAERRALLESLPQAALVADELPLRANLSVLENIAIVPQYRQNLSYQEAADQAWALLARVGKTDCALKRDPALTCEERFVAKLLRAVVRQPPIILIDRPALLLPDIHYPPFLETTLQALAGDCEDCRILDYAWNAPLYAPR